MLTSNNKRHEGSSIKSNETSITYKYSKEKCRVCLNDGEIPIFGINNISNDVNVFGDIVVSEDDDLPQYLCDVCHTLLEAAILFRKTAKQAEEVLKRPHYLENASEDSDNCSENENEASIKSEYLEFDYNSDPELSYDYKIKKEISSDDDNVTIPETNVQETKDNKDFQETLVNMKQVEEMNNDVGKNMFMIILSEKSKDNQMQVDCEKCNLTLDTVEELATHYKTNHSEVPVNKRECDICHKFVDNNSYNVHIKEHRENYKEKHNETYCKVKCEICNKIISKAYLKHHTKMHETPDEIAVRSVKCPLCTRMFTANYFPDHMRRAHDEKNTKIRKMEVRPEEKLFIISYKKCPVCDKQIKEDEFKLHLSKHGRTHRRFICDQCGKVFVHQSSFKTHLLTHGSELKYKCQFCPYIGLHQALLKIHIRTHTGDYNYKCTECPAKFITKSNLSNHLLRHQGARKFKCLTCEKCFYAKRDLKKHILNIHMNVKTCICKICGKTFGHRDNMLSHQLKVHDRERIVAKGRMPSYLRAQQQNDSDTD